ncbi:MAG TPA: hypothetical protein VGK93_12520 [Candidatus Eisenbacteria bacterium]
MKPGPTTAVHRAVPLLLVLVAGGCSSKVTDVFLPNHGPEVRLTLAPVSTQGKNFYAYRMNWIGSDPDGRVDHYLISVDPPRADTVDSPPRNDCPDDSLVGHWCTTPRSEKVVFFRATLPDTTVAEPGFPDTAIDYHVFAVAAVDNRGAVSTPVWRAFNAYNLCPKVEITSPDVPKSENLAFPSLAPSVRFRWSGRDEDGQFTQKPVKYKFRLFGQKDDDFPGNNDVPGYIISNPSVLRRKYGPTFSSWDSSSADTTEHRYAGLNPKQYYLFAVTGFDEAGAYDPIFSHKSNLLYFQVTFAGLTGPQIGMFNEFFFYLYSSGGYSTDPYRFFRVEIPADQPVTFNWFGLTLPGVDVRRYRWVMDLADLSNETPRDDQEKDWRHWSIYSRNTISATVGPFDPDLPVTDKRGGREHFFYIEAEDNNNLKSLGIIDFSVVRPTFDKPLLFVDDTRLSPDELGQNGQILPPRQIWPNRAELDTFFFAKGGVPYKPPYPSGSLSPRGIFQGYDFETTGTRGILNGIMPLSRLGQYRKVVWYTDNVGATYLDPPSHPFTPSTSLRWMSSPGFPNTLATYLKQGGEVWLFGGGAALANLGPWNKGGTDADVFTPRDKELLPGRMMYDFARWQSEVTASGAVYAGKNIPAVTGKPESSPGRPWLNGPIQRTDVLDYGVLPDHLSLNGSDPPDPIPPLRNANNFIVQDYPAEILTKGSEAGNYILEDVDPSDEGIQMESTLDTLCVTSPPTWPLMTYYHGPTSSRFVFSGFPLWYFHRSEQIQVADFVLGQIFGLHKSDAARNPAKLRAARTR